MPSNAVHCRRSPRSPRSTRIALPALVLACAIPLGAQAPTHGIAINAAGETARDRAPLFFGSAYVAPDGYLGLSLTGSALADRAVFLVGDQLGDVYERGWGSTVSAVWGATARLTLGTQLSVSRTELDYRWPVPPTTSDGSPSRGQRRFGSWGPGDLRLHGRYRLLDAGGRTLALNASVSLPNNPWGYGSVGLALAQRVGRASLHVAPELRFRQRAAARTVEFPGEAPYHFPGRAPVTVDLRTGAAFAITRRISWTLEGMGTNLVGSTIRDPRLFELGTGLRFDLGKALLDVGYRRVMLAEDGGANAVGRQQLFIGTHWKF